MSTASLTAKSAPRQRDVQRLAARARRDLPCYLFVLPALAIYGVFTLWPMLTGAYFALFDWTGTGAERVFLGLDNFREVARDPYFWNAFRNTFSYMFGVVPIQLFLALVIAVLLNNRRLRGTAFFRTLFFLPVVTNTAIIGVVMGFMFSPLYGPVNKILVSLHLIATPIDWLSTGRTALLTVVVVAIWKNLGIHMIYWLAALQTVPEELYDAGKIDGANRWQLFRYVTVPTVMPIGIVIIVLALVGSLKVFDLIKAMTDGGPFFATEVITVYIYRFAFSAETGAVRLGYAAAAAVLFAAVMIVIAVAQGLLLRQARAWRHDV